MGSKPDPEDDRRPLREPADLFFDRDRSLLAFQRRLLDEARDAKNPLLERVRFLGIIGSNIDEFTMTRWAELTRDRAGVVTLDPGDAAPGIGLDWIRSEVVSIMRDARRYFSGTVIPALAEAGIQLRPYADLSEPERAEISQFFTASVLPLLMPLGLDAERPFPLIGNRGATLAAIVRDRQGVERFACVRVPDTVPALVPFRLRGTDNHGLQALGRGFVWLDEVVGAGLGAVFPGLEVVGAYPFRVVRDADLNPGAGAARGLPEAIQEGVRARQFGGIVAFVADDRIPPRLLDVLVENLCVPPQAVHRSPGMRDIGRLVDVSRIDRSDLRFPRYVPARQEVARQADTLLDSIGRRDVLLHHPYESFEPVVELFEAAARDPEVLAISITLYRIDRHSRIVKALLDARRNGKAVRVVVELRARFDEENNVAAARALTRAGAHVVYGVPGLKVHTKLSLLVRRGANGVRRYVHVSSGNYNAETATAYTDIALLTSDEQIASDVADLFNVLTGHGETSGFRRLLVAPTTLRQRICRLIQDEIDCHDRSKNGHIILKMNALEDPEVIRALYQASRAGVEIDLIVRGICCLRPGVKGLSDRIRVRSIVGRFLEHSRVWYFRNDGQERAYIGSADLMTRNLDRRVEVMVPVQDPALIRRLRDEILAIYLTDTVKAHALHSDGSYTRVPQTSEAAVSSHESLIRVALAGRPEPRPAGPSPGVPFSETMPFAFPILAPIFEHEAVPQGSLNPPGTSSAGTPLPPGTTPPPLSGLPSAGTGQLSDPSDPDGKKKAKKKSKARSAWISFSGRIIAQVVGAVATIFLSVYVLDKYTSGRRTAPEQPVPQSTAQVSPRPARVATGKATLAVLPLRNFSGNAQQEYFVDGLTEALIAGLAQTKGLQVISRTSSMHYKGQNKPLPEIAQELGVDWIVEGSIVSSGGRVRIRAQLIDAKRDVHIWAKSYERTSNDVMGLQGEVADAIATAVGSVVKGVEQNTAAPQRPVDAAVFDLYLRGRYAWNLRTPAGFQEAIRYFEAAIQKDPGFALAYAGLADAYQLGGGPAGATGPSKAKDAARRAIELDDKLAEAHASLGAIYHRTDINVRAAEQEFRRALELNAGYATAHQWYALMLAEAGRNEEATRYAQQAVMLDPLSGPMHQTLGLVHYYGRRYDQSLAEERRALELAPQLSLPRQFIPRALVARGAYDEAIRFFGQEASAVDPDSQAMLAAALSRSGDRARGDVILQQLLARKPVPAAALTRWYAVTGDRQRAMDMLRLMVTEQSRALQTLRFDPVLDPLRTDPRFAELFDRANPPAR